MFGVALRYQRVVHLQETIFQSSRPSIVIPWASLFSNSPAALEKTIRLPVVAKYICRSRTSPTVWCLKAYEVRTIST